MDNTEQVDVRLPSGETVTVNVPQGMGDNQIHQLLRQKQPQLFNIPVRSPNLEQQSQIRIPTQAPPPASSGQAPNALERFFSSAAEANPITGLVGSMLKQSRMSDEDVLRQTPATREGVPLTMEQQARQTGGIRGMLQPTPLGPIVESGIKGYGQLKSGDIAGAAGTGLGLASSFFMPGKQAKLATAETMPEAEMFRAGLQAAAHDWLNKGMNDGKGKLWDAHEQVSNRVGRLVENISAADISQNKGQPSIYIADLWKKMKDVADRYNAGKDLPRFKAAAEAVQNSGGKLTWKQLHDLREEIGTQWDKTPDGTRDAAAVSELLRATADKLGASAKDLDRSTQYEAYTTLWRTLKQYENKGIIGKLQGAQAGQEFFGLLRNPKVAAELERASNSLEQFGLPEDYFKGIVKAYKPLHDYVNTEGSLSKYKLAFEHPLSAIPGLVAGTGLGTLTGHPFIGGSFGAIAAARLAGRLGASRAISKLGGALPLTGEMEEAAKVMPKPISDVPRGPKTIQSAGVSQGDLVSALKNLGYTKTEALARAVQAIRANPNDFDAALRSAMGGK